MDYTSIVCRFSATVAVQTQAICNCRITARAVIWFTCYFPNFRIFGKPQYSLGQCRRATFIEFRMPGYRISGKTKVPNIENAGYC